MNVHHQKDDDRIGGPMPESVAISYDEYKLTKIALWSEGASNHDLWKYEYVDKRGAQVND